MKTLSSKVCKSIAFVLICILFLSLNNASAQWQQTNGPIGVTVNCMIQHDTVVVCGTQQGIYFSSDSGYTWQQYSQFQNKNIQSIYSRGDTLIMLFSSGFLEDYYYDSTFSVTSFDNGITWTNPVMLSIFGDIPATLHDAFAKVIAVDVYNGPSVTYDYGLSWSPLQLPPGNFADLKFTGKNYMFLMMEDGSFEYLFYLSRLDTISFILTDTANSVRDKCAVDSVLFGSDSITPGYIDIIKSVDYGQTWSTITTTNSHQNFSTIAVDSVFCFLTASSYLKFTIDFGVSWDSVPSNTYPYFLQYKYSIDLGNSNLLVTNGIGFSIYNTSSDSATSIPNTITGSVIKSISSNDSVIYCMNYFDVFKTTNDGSTWDAVTSPGFFVAPQIIIGDTLFATNFDVYKSFDGGLTWSTFTIPSMVFYMAKKGNRLFASSTGATYYSDDFGDTWLLVPDPPPQTACGFSSNGGSLCTYANHLFFADDYFGAIFRLDQNDHSWTYLFCIGFDPFATYDEPIMLTLNNTVVVSSYLGIFHSNDTGATWTASACNGLPLSINGAKIYPTSIVARGSDWIAACGKAGVLYSYDSGNNWQPFGGPSPFVATGVTISHDQLFVSTLGSGVWTTSIPLSIMNPTDQNNYVQVYPNPASGVVNIGNLKATDYPNILFVYDRQGRMVMRASVNTNEPINLSSLSPGVYFCRIINRANEVKVCRVVVE